MVYCVYRLHCFNLLAREIIILQRATAHEFDH